MVKKGMANSVKPPKELYMISGTMITGVGEKNANIIIEVSPKVRKMGNPEQSKITKVITNAVVMIAF